MMAVINSSHDVACLLIKYMLKKRKLDPRGAPFRASEN
jgi:hypothetical protein